MTISFARITRRSPNVLRKSIFTVAGTRRSLARITIAMAVALFLLTVSAWSAAPTAQTDLASIIVTPLTPQANSTADWRTLYDYSGGNVLPPGTRITATGKWIEPHVREDKSGVTFAFPDLPAQPQSAQDLNVAYAVETPLANYPTRITIHYTPMQDPLAPNGAPMWPPFRVTTAEYGPRLLANQKRGSTPGNETEVPIQSKGDNALVFTLSGQGQVTATLNDKDVSDLLARGGQSLGAFLTQPGAMLLPGIALRGAFTQQPNDKGDWFAVNSLKIEQLRPPLESSSVAAVDLKVPGTEPIRVTIEVTDDKNDSKGYLLRDSLVSPGTYHLYWDGIDQKQSQAKNTTWIAAGSYSFHLTSSKTNVTYAGEINNSAPKYNRQTYGMVNCTALAMTPPGTTLQPAWAQGSPPDKRKLDPTDSVQLDCVWYDANYGQWVGADGTVFSTKTGSVHQQNGRGLAVTPPDPADPTNPAKQFYFVSRPALNNDFVISGSLPSALQNAVPKILTSPDWNRTPAGFLPFHFQIGRLPYMVGPQKYLFFQMSRDSKDLHAEWIFRNVRLYEEGAPDPGPMVFDASNFTPRLKKEELGKPAPPVQGVSIEDAGHSVHVTNSGSVNYPIDYTITPHTVLAFELQIVDHSNIGNTGNGIGLDVQPVDLFPGNLWRYMNFTATTDPGRFGVFEPALGAYNYPFYAPNTLYTDTVPLPPQDALRGPDMPFLWQPGFYGLNVSEDGKLLFVCNNSDHRLEVRDISTDGSAIAKIPMKYPMFAALAPVGAEGAPAGSRYIYITSPEEGIMRIAWKIADNTFGPPTNLTTASEFAYPRGIAYDAVSHRLFVCDTFDLHRTKVANQIAVIDPLTGKVVSRFGKPGGVNPSTGGTIGDDAFTCPLTIAADSKGALWVNDYYSCEVRKYDFNATSNGFSLERRVLGTNTTNTSHFYWMPGDPPTRIWTFSNFFVRNDAELDSDGRFTNPRTTSAVYNPLASADTLRPYAHFQKIGSRSYGVFYSDIYEQVKDGWVPRFKFGDNAGRVARDLGLLALPGQPPTDLDKAIAASGDPKWEQRPWAWSDLDGDGKMEYSDANPEFQIAFNSPINLSLYIPRTGCLRTTDGAFVCPAKGGLAIIPQKSVNGKIAYTWENAKLLTLKDGDFSDVLAQNGRYYVLRCSTERHDMGDAVISNVSCFDDAGNELWTRDQNEYSLTCLQSLGDDMISIMDRGGWTTEGPVFIRTTDGDLVSQIFCQEAGDCWSHGALRSDADTAYIGMVQAYKVTGLRTVKSATATTSLPAGGP